LAGQLESRGVTALDSGLAKIAKILPAAAAVMDTAEKSLSQGTLKDALGPEQRALQQLQRAEAEYRTVRISMGQQGGGGGGGNTPEAEDLADLFELQQERMRNQYETVQRGQDEQQRQSAEVDAAAERLRQLAARQQQQNERAQRKADSASRNMGASGASGGESQRQLAQDVEQAARQLERLARERQSESLNEAARRLNEASDAMRRAAAQGGAQQGAAASQQAMDRLREARRLLDQERTDRTQRAVEDAVSAGRRLAEQQQRVNEDVARSAQATGAQREEIQRSIEQRKGAMADSARALGRLLDRAANEARREAPAVSREMNEAADTLRARRVEDKIRTTQEWVRQSPPESQARNERIIAADIESVNRSLEEIRGAARAGRQADTTRRNAEALDRARDLVRGVESLNERAQQQSERAARGERGEQTGERGQQGQSQAGQSGQGQSSGQQAQGQAGGGGGNPEGRDGGPGGNLGREMRQRLNDARALRRELSGRGVDLSQLDRAIQRMEGLTNAGGSMSDPRAEAELREQVINGLRAFEFGLGRAFGQQPTERAFVDRAGEVPPEYRKSVEEYYRSLGRSKQP
ncbi:MAG TPA: hypothetical protein VFO66_07490, partial [Gemmatimonadaceae bacterium]|nr:hypothetical protein [Gemmatimonadaceae bacterium]